MAKKSQNADKATESDVTAKLWQTSDGFRFDWYLNALNHANTLNDKQVIALSDEDLINDSEETENDPNSEE